MVVVIMYLYSFHIMLRFHTAIKFIVFVTYAEEFENLFYNKAKINT